MKKSDQTLNKLIKIFKKLEREVSEMESRVDFLQKEAEPEAYRRWYLSSNSLRNIKGLIEVASEQIDEYQKYKTLPWTKRIFRRSGQ